MRVRRAGLEFGAAHPEHGLFLQERDNTMTVPLPPVEYMRLVCGDVPDLEAQFVDMSEGIGRWLGNLGLVGPNVTFLDVGCGCGRIARALLEVPLAGYVGFDRHPGMIEWCQREIASQAPHFQFHLFEIKSAYGAIDGHQGSIEASRFRFPFPPDTFDVCLLSSVFTHMPMDEVARYLEELYTVTRRGGRVFCSLFCTATTACARGHNFCLDRTTFLTAVEKCGFSWELKGKFKTGFAHNWYLLTKE